MMDNDRRKHRRLHGFPALLKAVSKAAVENTSSVAEQLTLLLTLDGKVPLSTGLQQLAIRDRSVVNAVLSLRPKSTLSRIAPTTSGTDASVYQFVFNDMGRPHFRPVHSHIPLYKGLGANTVVASCDLPERVLQSALEIHKHEDLAEKTATVELWRRFISENEDWELLVDTLTDKVRHVDNVYWYVGDMLWSIMERATTLVSRTGRPGILETIRTRRWDALNRRDRLGIAAMSLLLSTGGVFRLEELNGTCITAINVLETAQRCKSLQSQVAIITPHTNAYVNEYTALKQDQPTLLRHREINGLLLQKCEHIRHVHTIQTDQILRTILARISDILGHEKRWTQTESWEEIVAWCLDQDGRKMFPIDVATAATSRTELLIEELVRSATTCTDADYGMSSSIRDFGQFTKLCQSSLQKLSELPASAYFCCFVTSSTAPSGKWPVQTQKRISRLVQSRMQYNRWHFVPGNFPKHAPANRHYFYPPVLSDITVWSDHHHGGHVDADVRYSVRCPGPDVHESPLRIAKQEFRGFYDIRVARSTQPFAWCHLLIVRQHNLWLGVLVKEIIRRAMLGENTVIRGFEPGCYSTTCSGGQEESPAGTPPQSPAAS